MTDIDILMLAEKHPAMIRVPTTEVISFAHAIRNAMLEEAAEHVDCPVRDSGKVFAIAIRALKTKEGE